MAARLLLLPLACMLLLTAPTPAQTRQSAGAEPKSPIVLVVGCAAPGPQPHLWILSRAAARSESSRPAITAAEKSALTDRALGQDTYHLIGVADFVDPESSRAIGRRGEILTKPRVNATGMLAAGHKVAVKGLYIQATPPRINLTSVVDLAPSCP